MLRVTVEQGEYVLIGDNIRIYYDRLNSNKQLVLSFDAPREVEITRQRIYEERIAEQLGDTPEGRRLTAELQAKKEARERAQAAREERRRQKRELRKLAN